jgi:hypothetical protein
MFKASPGMRKREEEIMSRLQTRLNTWMMVLCVLFVMSGISALAATASSTDDQTPSQPPEEKKKQRQWRGGDQAAATDASATRQKSKRARRPLADAASSDFDRSERHGATAKKTSKKSKKSAAVARASRYGR